MREVLCRNGSVAVYDETDDQDMVVIEPVVINFIPVSGNARCTCGAPLAPWNWRCVAVDEIELACGRCHRVHGHFQLSTRVHR